MTFAQTTQGMGGSAETSKNHLRKYENLIASCPRQKIALSERTFEGCSNRTSWKYTLYFLTTVSGYDKMAIRQEGFYDLSNLDNIEKGNCLILPLETMSFSQNKVGMTGVKSNPAKINIAVQLYERDDNPMCVVAADSGSGKSVAHSDHLCGRHRCFMYGHCKINCSEEKRSRTRQHNDKFHGDDI